MKEKGQANHAQTRKQNQLDFCECERKNTYSHIMFLLLLPLLQLALLFDPFSLLADGERSGEFFRNSKATSARFLRTRKLHAKYSMLSHTSFCFCRTRCSLTFKSPRRHERMTLNCNRTTVSLQDFQNAGKCCWHPVVEQLLSSSLLLSSSSSASRCPSGFKGTSVKDFGLTSGWLLANQMQLDFVFWNVILALKEMRLS